MRRDKKTYFARIAIVILLFCFFSCFVSKVEAYQVKRVIRGSYTMDANTETATVDISALLGTPVDPLNTAVSVLFVTKSANSTDHTRVDVIGLIDDPTHVLFARFAAVALNIEYTIIEFASGAFVYSGMTTIPENINSKTITLPTNVTIAKAFPLLSSRAFRHNDTVDEYNVFIAEITGVKTLTINRSESASRYNNDLAYQVVAFDSTEADVNVQKGSVNINNSVGAEEATDDGTVLTANVTAVDPAKSFLTFTVMPDTAVNGDETLYAVDGTITNATTLTFTRNRSSSTGVTIKWNLVEFKNQVLVQQGRVTGITTNSSIGSGQGFSTDVYSNRCFTLITTSGAGSIANTTGVDEVNYRAGFSSSGTPPTSSSFTVTRESTQTTTTSNISWFVTEFPPLNIKYPNGGEPAFRVEDNIVILWEHAKEMETGGTHADGSVKVKLLLDKNSGVDGYPLTIATGVSSKSDAYNWTIPNTLNPGSVNVIGNKLRIRVQCEEVFTVRNFDDSNADFEIKGSFVITMPDSGVDSANPWKVGETTRNINWTPKGDLNGVGSGTVKIELSTNGATWDTLTASVAAGNHNQSCSWTWNPIPNEVNAKNVIGTDNLIKITHNSDSAVTNTSPAFCIKGQIYSIVPDTAVTWLLGETKTISWSKKGHFGAGVADGTVDIYYSSNGGLSYGMSPIASGVAAGTDALGGSYNWTIPALTETSNLTSKIKVVQSTDSTVFSESVDFYIKPSMTLDTPVGGEIWRFGETKNVEWTPHGNLGFVVIKYKVGAGIWNYLPGAAPADNLPAGTAEVKQSKSWAISNPLGSNVTVRVAQKGSEDTVFDDCNAPISLKANISISEPHLNEMIKVTNATEGNKKTINWSVNGSITGTAHISLSKDSGSSWPITLTTGTLDINLGAYSWTILDTHIGADRVKVSLDGDTDATTGTSGVSAACKVVPYLKLTYPNQSGLTYYVSNTVFIKWIPDPATFGTVDIRYDANSGKGANGTPGDADDYQGFIADGIASNNIPSGETDTGFKWTISDVPGIVSDTVRIKVYQTGKASEVFSEGTYDFGIKGSVTVTGEADGGFTWKIGQSKYINWTAVGSLGTVDILYTLDGINYIPLPLQGGGTATGVPCISGENSYYWDPLPNNAIANDKNTLIKFKVKKADIEDVSGGTTTILAQISNVRITANLEASNVIRVDDPGDVAARPKIEWDTYGSVSQVILAYDKNSAGTFTGMIAGGGAISNINSYDWPVPNDICNDVKIRVKSSVSSTDVYADSSVTYKIKGKIKITSPNVGVTGANAWLVNGTGALAHTYLIEWTNFGDLGPALNGVNIYYSDNGGTQYVLVKSASGENGPQSTSWTIPSEWGTPVARNTIGSDNLIKITDADDEAVVFKESASFEIKGQILLTSPSSGQIYYIGGSDIPVTWNLAGTLGNIDIFFSSNGGTSWGTALATIDAGYTQPYLLAVPNTPTVVGKIKLEQVSDRANVVSATGDPGFAIKGGVILMYPKNEPTLKVNVDTLLNITWELTGAISLVAIDYDKYSGAGFDSIAGNADDYAGVVISSTNAGPKAYPWTIPADSSAVSNNVRIRVRDAGDGTVKDASTADFKIKPVIELLAGNNDAPLGGESWLVNQPHTIKWSPKGFGAGEQVKIEYSDNGGGTWPGTGDYLINAGISASALQFSWPVTETVPLSSQCLVRISKVGDAEAKVESNWFTLKGKVDITQPDGNINLPINSNYTIKWSKTGNVSNCALYYSTDAAHTNWLPVPSGNNVPAGDGTTGFNWTIPESSSTTVKVRIDPTSASDPTDTNDSQSDNAIIGSIALTNPNPATGDTLTVDTPYTVSWNQFGGISSFNVYISYNKTSWIQIGTNVTATSLPLNWATLGGALSDQVHFRVADATNANVVTETTAASKIKGSLVIDEPHISEQLEVSGGAANKNIIWTKHGDIGTLTIVGSTNAFLDETQNFNIVSGWPSATIPYPWVVNDKISNTVKIRVTTPDLVDSLKLSVQSAQFVIKGKLTIDTPGSTWKVGEANKTITWSSNGTVGNVLLEYYNGSVWGNVATVTAGSPGWTGVGAGSYTWPTVGDAKGANCKLRVSDPDDPTGTVKIESGVFAIYPNITVTLDAATVDVQSNNAHFIHWSRNGSTKLLQVRIDYDTVGGTGGYGNVISALTDASLEQLNWDSVPVTPSDSAKIRVADVDDAGFIYAGFSSGTFKILGKLNITSPNGAAALDIKTAANIVVSASGVNNVTAYYSTDNGTNYNPTAIGSSAVAGGVASIAWTTPDVVTDTAKIKVIKTGEDVATALTYAVSNSLKLFEKFTNIQPAAGASLMAGDPTTINWTQLGTNLANVKLYLSSNNGTSWTALMGGLPVLIGSRPISWDVPTDVHSIQCLIKVESTVNANNYGVSGVNGVDPEAFVIKNKLTITSPTTGTPAWSVGSMYPITWNYVGPYSGVNIKIEYSPDPGTVAYAPIPGAANVSLSTTGNGSGSWDWTIANNTVLTTTGKIKITDNAIPLATDTSLGNLTIRGNIVPQEIDVMNPTVEKLGGVPVLRVGSSYNVFWTRYGEVTQVNLYYSKNGVAGPWTKINTLGALDATVQYGWAVPVDGISNTVRLKVEDANNSNVSNITTADFIIAGQVAITKPDLAEADWVVGDPASVKWIPTGSFPSSVKIEGSRNGFSDELQVFAITTVAAGATGVEQTYTLPSGAPDQISSNVKIRVADSDATRSSIVKDLSTNTFIIKGKLTIDTPVATWKVGESNKSITWTSNGTVGDVLLEYYNGSAWGNVATVTAGSPGWTGVGAGSFTWPTVGDGKGANCKLRVTDPDDPTGTVKIESGVFAIYPNITVTLDAATVDVQSNNAHFIHWSRNGSTKLQQVRIDYDTVGGTGGYGNVISALADASLEQLNWDSVPVTPSDSAKIRVADVDDAGFVYAGFSTGTFKILGKLNITAPNGASPLDIKTAVNIVVSASGVNNVTAYYSTNNGTSYNPTAIGSSVVSGGVASIAWTTPDVVTDTVKVKVIKTGEDVDTALTKAVSNPLSLFEKFTNITPSAGVSLTAGDSTSINWTQLGTNLAAVKLWISTNNGGAWTALFSGSDVLVGSRPVPWDVPTDVHSIQCLIKVQSTVNPNNYGVSGANGVDPEAFVIKNKLTITSPTTGTPAWSVGTGYPITWDYIGPYSGVNIKIEYSPTGLIGDYGIIPGAANVALDDDGNGSGSWLWTIADATVLCNATGKIRITDTAIATATHTSNGGLTIRGNVVPQEIDVTNPLVEKLGGVPVLRVGTSYNVFWARYGEVTQVNLYYSKNSAAGPWTLINTGGPLDATLQYSWAVPADGISNTVRLKVEDANNSNVSNITTADFIVAGQISITKPDLAEPDWVVGDPASVKWIPTGSFPSSVKIEGSRNGFSDELQVFAITTVAAGATGVEQTYTLPSGAPDQISNNVKIRVADSDATRAGIVKDVSANAFIIKGKLTITTPGSTWYVNDANKVIQWNATGTIGNVKLEYYNGTAWTQIIASTSTGAGGTGAGSFTWPNVGDGKTANCQLRVTDTDDSTGTVNATSGVFALYPKITVSEPIAGANVQVTSNNPDLIKWSLNNSSKVVSVDIYYDTNGGAGGYPNKINTLPVDATLLKYTWNNVPVTTSNNVKIKVQDVDDATGVYFGATDAFQIIGKVTMSQPDGTAWTILKNGVYNIVGTAQGVVNVSAYYSTSNGGAGSYVFIGSAVVAGGNYSIGWNTPDAVSETVKVKVIKTGEAVDTTPESAVSPVFSLYEEFSNIQPSNGSTFTANDPTSITWSKLGSSLANVKLYLSADNGSNYTFIKQTANSGIATWDIPLDVRSMLCKLKVESALNVNNYAVSSGVFLIKNRITITNPTVGTPPWSVGTKYTLAWTYQGPELIDNNPLTPVKVKIEYSPTGLIGDYAIIPGAADVVIGIAGSGSWDWTIADSTTLCNATGKIRVTDTGIATATGTSGGGLTIRGNVVPNEIVGSPLKVGDPYNLSWTRYGEITQVNLYYSINGTSGPWIKINTGGAWDATQVYPWSVSDAISNNVRIKVEDANNTNVNNTTTADFAIIGKIQITKPTIGEADWVVGDPVLVKWIPTGTYTSVKIEGSRNAFSDENQVFLIATLAAGATGIEQTHNFNAPDQISSNVKIRVSDADVSRSSLVKDVCQNPFIIKGKLTITTPGSTWYVNDANKTIQWNATGTIGNVKLEYYNGTAWTQIIASTPTGAGGTGAGSFTWPNIGDGKTAVSQLRVTDIDDATGTVKATSGTFALYPKITVSEPIAGANVQVTSNNPDLIKWSLNNSSKVVSVDIYYDTNGGAGGYPNKINTLPVDATLLKYTWNNVPVTTSNNVKIKVQDVDDATGVYFGATDAFQIIGKVTMSQPDGTAWTILKNGVYNIVGTAQGIVNVSAYYSTSNGGAGSYVFIGSAVVAGGNYSIGWNTPDAVSETVKVKVIKTGEAVDTTPESAVSPTFSLYEEFSNIQPSNGSTLTATDSTSVTWGKLGNSLANVKVYLSTNNGSAYTFIKNATNTGSTSWDVPTDVRSTLCKLKIESALNVNNYAESAGVFVIKHKITVTNPTVGTPPWSVGTKYTLAWTYQGPDLIDNNPLTPVKVKIEYSPTGLIGDYAIIPGAGDVTVGTAGSGSWDWTIADTTTLCNAVGKIRVTDTGIATATGTSGGGLTIRGNVVPNEIVGSPLKVGDPYNLSWTRYGEVTQVNLYYSINGTSGPWTKINTSGPWDATQVYPWTVSDAISNTMRIKVEDANNTSVNNTTTTDFAIIGKVQITKPNIAELDWVVGDPVLVKWIPTGTYTSVKIEGSRNGFSDENQVFTIATVAAGATSVEQTYNFNALDQISSNVKIRVADSDVSRSSLVKSISQDAFIIKGKLTITTPGATWRVNDANKVIQWNATGTVGNVRLEYYDGTIWRDVIASTPTGAGGTGAGSYTWPNVGDGKTPNCQLRVTDIDDSTGTVKAVSGTFALYPRITISEPLLDSYIRVGSDNPDLVKWSLNNSSKVTQVDIYFDTNGGLDGYLDKINGAPVDAALLKYSWNNVPDRLSTNVKIKIVDIDEPDNVFAISPLFLIVGKIDFIDASIPPQAGEKWGIGQLHTIRWTKQGSISTVRLSYSTDGTTYNQIQDAAGGSGDVGINWTVPNIEGIVSNTVTLKIYDITQSSLVKDTTANFSVVPSFTVTAPVLNSEAKASQTYTITWNRLGFNNYVKLYYSLDNFSAAGIPISDTEGTGDGQFLIKNDGSFMWQVPDVISNNIQVRVAYSEDVTVYDDSEVFRIVPAFTVVAPNTGSDEASVHQNYTIRWTCSSANVPKARIFYSKDGGTTYPFEITQGPNYADNTGAVNAERSFVWNTDDAITTQFRAKITDVDAVTDTAFDESDFNGKIKAWFNIQQPNGDAAGNQIFYVDQNGVASDIAWQWEGSVLNVKLDYCKDNNWAAAVTIVASTPNDGSYSFGIEGWKIPDFISDTVKIRVSDVDAGHPTANDASDNYFKIKGVLNVITPNGASDKWDIGSTQTIRWHSTGTMAQVKIIAYSTDPGDLWFRDGGGAVYTLANPLVIANSYANNPHNTDTTRSWLIPDNASNKVKIRVIDVNDVDLIVLDDSDAEFVIKGTFNVTSPAIGDRWLVGSVQNIAWGRTGSSITQAKITYSTDNGGSWNPVVENEGMPNDGIVANDGSFSWTVPDSVTALAQALIKIEDPGNSEVNDISDGFKIIGAFAISSPAGGERWVTNEPHMLNWNTTGTVNKVNIFYSKDNFATDIQPVVSGKVNVVGANSHPWIIPDDRADSVKIRVVDFNDSTVYADSPAFKIDYYNISWDIRDFLTNLPIGGGLSVNDTSGWVASGLSSDVPIVHATPYGSWSAAWTHPDYGDKSRNYVADSDQTLQIYLESKVVHVWEAKTEYVYDNANDKMTFNSTLIRDGSVVTGAKNCTIEIFNPDSPDTVLKTLTDTTPDTAGFFSMVWNSTGLSSSKVYNARTVIENVLGGIFKTPFLISISTSVALYDVKTTVASVLDKPISQVNTELQATLQVQTNTIDNKLTEQRNIITTKMDEQKTIIVDKTNEMKSAVETSLASFETRSNEAIVKLQSGADQAVEAGKQATDAAANLEATAKKYSWAASVSPNPALSGERISLQCQGQPATLPRATIYSWDNKTLIPDQLLFESIPGLYTMEFDADARFAPGKSYTYVISEPITGGLVSGSGMVESMSITSIAGLASAAPGAESAAKKALEEIQKVQDAILSGEGEKTNITVALKNLQKSVAAFPEIIAKEGPSARLNHAVDEISDRIKSLMGEEGFDISALMEQALAESPTMKQLRSKTDAINGVIELLMQLFEQKFGGSDTPVVSTSLQPGSVKFRIVAANPSKIKSQNIEIKYFLPKEVSTKDVMDLGGMDIEYDSAKAIYYVYRSSVELSPGEIRSFEVEVEDVWVVAQSSLDEMKSRVDIILAKLKETDYYNKVKEIADTIYPRLTEIISSQADDSVSREQHIGIYRQNQETIQKIKEDIAKMEKILATAGGPLAPELLTKTKIKSEAPTKSMTWIVIFIVITFIGLLAGVLFFTWQHQSQVSKDELLAAKRSAFPQSGSKEQSPNEKK